MKFFSRTLLPLILLAYIAVETYAKLHHTSICGSEGCKLAGQLLNFPSLYLNFMGLAAVAVILILGWLSLKRPEFEALFFVALYAAIGFETIMFAYQFLVNPEPCIFCGGVYGGLLLIALASRPRWLLYALPIIVALWVALSTLAIPKNMELISADGTYLIHSETCPHCKKVKAYFAEHKIPYRPIDVHTANARFLLKNLGINEIPVLLIRDHMRTSIFKGDKPIIAHFQKGPSPTQTVSSTQATQTPPLQSDDKGGCALDQQIDATPGEGGCEQENDVPLR